MNRIAMIIINFICMLIAPKEKDTYESLGGVHAWRERGGQISKEDINTPPPLGSYPPIAGGILQKNLKKI